MTQVEQLAAFVTQASYEHLSNSARQQLKIRILDSLACGIGALEGKPLEMLRAYLHEVGGTHSCTLIGAQGFSSPDRAAFYNGGLIRYLDYNDSYLAAGETCHPSDNLSTVLAAAEHAGCHGRNLLEALAVAYQVHCRLSDVAPVRARGFDHTTQGSYAVAAGTSKALGLETAHAIAISGTAFNALRVTRTGTLSHWKGLAYPNTAFGGMHAVLLAKQGITGPLEIFEGKKGFMDSIAGHFSIDWLKEDLESVTRTIIKKYNAEIHSQSVIEGILELQQEKGFSVKEIQHVDIEIFDVAYHIIGGGEEGNKTRIHTKEQADHSLPYIAAVALIDGNVMPAQYLPQRIQKADAQSLLQKITVHPLESLSQRFPEEMPCQLTVTLKEGQQLVKTKQDYEGFYTRPVQWETIIQKFNLLSQTYTDNPLREAIIHAVDNLETIAVNELTELLKQVKIPDRSKDHYASKPKEITHMEHERGYQFLRLNQRQSKPRTQGLTEIRGPYYSVMGKRYLRDILETMGAYIDSVKFAGGAFTLLPRSMLEEMIATVHEFEALVSTGGFIERVLTQGPEAVAKYIQECKTVGFDIIEISCGFITIPIDDWLRLVEKVQQAGLKAKPEIGIQFGAGGATSAEALASAGTQDPEWMIQQARRFLDAGAHMLMIESEEITENVTQWRTDVVAKVVNQLGLEKVMFEAADPEVFAWYIKNYGPETNLFVDHRQIVQLEFSAVGPGEPRFYGDVYLPIIE